MGLREDIREVNRLSKFAGFEPRYGYDEIWQEDEDFYIAARKLFKQSGDSIEIFVDIALTVKPTPEEHDQEDE